MARLDDDGDEGESGRAIAARAVRGSAQNATAAAITMTLAGVRTVLLLRLLSPADFGVYALAVFFNNLAGQLRAVGLEPAFIQRRVADPAAVATYFTLRILLLLASLAALLSATPIVVRFYPDMPALGPLIAAYAGVTLIHGPSIVQETLLLRNLEFARVARVKVAASASMTVVAPLLAWNGFGVWSLVGEFLAGELARAVLVWGPFRRWTPRFGWDGEVARSFWRYGIGVWFGQSLNFLLHHVDDFFVGTALGKVALGYYSRAFDLGSYAQRGLWTPLNVLLPLFARLQHDRLRLSQSFFRVTSFVVRLGAAAFLVVALAARDGVLFLFGERWLPIVVPLQLMIAYRMLNLVGSVINELLLAAGRPQVVARVRSLQLGVFLPTMILFGSRWGIAGVAMASVVAAAVAVLRLHGHARELVDYSLARLLFWPAAALAAIPAVVAATSSVWAGQSPWLAGGGKALLAATLYAGLLWLGEREQLVNGVRMVRRLLVHAGEPD
jgi:PST family polysaccharide transporter